MALPSNGGGTPAKPPRLSLGLYDRVQNRSLGRPQWDQPPLSPTSTTDNFTLSHVHTTDYTESVEETEYDKDGVPKGKRKTSASSVISYHSSRDGAQYVKIVHGR